MPKLGESVVEGTVSKWLVPEGGTVRRDEPLLEVSTDKIDTEIPSPAAGILRKIYVSEGETVEAGALLAIIAQAHKALSDTEPSPIQPDPRSAPPPDATPSSSSAQSKLRFISPVVAKLAAEHQIDLSEVRGTGVGGRIRKKDILAFIERRKAEISPSPVIASASEKLAQADTHVIPLSRRRQLIAEHMVRSKRTSPHVTTVFICDMAAVVRHRYAQRQTFAQEGVELTFTPYLLSSLATALKQHPLVNSSWSKTGILLHRHVHIGLAVAIKDGLLVPVIKHADSLNLLGLARAVNELSQRARSNQLTADELQGGTFTLTNHGTSGSLFATPIINQPQTGILGVGAIHKEAVVLSQGHPLLPDANDTIAIRPVVYLSFTFDHRVLDGAAADAFVTTVKHILETWKND